jgi:hypothetical protein
MVEDAMGRVAVVDVAVEVAEDEGAAYEAVGARGWAPEEVVAHKRKRRRQRQ